MLFDKLKQIFKKKRTPEEQEAFDRELEENPLEKKDMPAMILSAYLVIIPVVIGVLALFALVAYLFTL